MSTGMSTGVRTGMSTGVSTGVTVIGCDGNAMPERAARVLAAARCVVGARRHLVDVAPPPGAERVELRDVGAALDKACAHPGPVVVLASGDPGFFGIVRLLRARGVRPEVIPAVSSAALAFARLGLPWDDALVVSAHGREPRRALAAALGCAKSAIFTAPGPEAGPQRFIPALLAAGREVHVAERLGTPEERLTTVTPGTDPAMFADPNVIIALDPEALDQQGLAPEARVPEVLAPEVPDRQALDPEALDPEALDPEALDPEALDPQPVGDPSVGQLVGGQPGEPGWIAGHPGAPASWALAEDRFGHAMITKAEVRALVLARLGPGPGRTVWDVGAGSGSVAIECARFGAYAIAIESDPLACERIRANAAAHGVRVHLVEGRAPAALDGLPPADAVFCGGGKDEVLAAAARGRPARIVAALASVDRVQSFRDLLTAAGYRAGGSLLQVSRLTAMPGHSMRLAGANPVFVIWGELP